MGVLSTLLQRWHDGSVERRSIAPGLSQGWTVGWTGTSEAGIVVNEHTALNSLLVMSCVRLIADTGASLPIIVYERTGDRGRKRASNHSMYGILHDAPNPEMTAFTWIERMFAHLLLWGNHYSIIERVRGHVVALWPVHPSRVEIERDSDEQPIYRVGGRLYPASDILHIPGLAMDGLMGLSPLAVMRQAIGMTVAAETYGSRFFANDARPSVLLKHPAALSDVARENLRQSWAELHGGGRGGVGILEEGMDFAAIGMPPEDAQFLETRRFQIQEFARYFRIPPHLLADVERSTSWGTGIEQQNIGFVVYTMRPWLVRIEQELMRKLLPEHERQRFYVEFLVDGLLRGDSKSRSESYAIARQWGWLSANDVRELENMNAIEGGDLYLHPMNMVTAEQAEEQSSLGGSPGTPTGERQLRAEQRAVDVSRQQRSMDARQRIVDRHRGLLVDVYRRLIRVERNEVRAQLKRGGLDGFAQWIRDYYYDKFPGKVVEYSTPALRSLLESIAAECVDEIGGEMPASEDMERWLEDYVAVLAKRHCGTSRSRLLAILGADERAESTPATQQVLDEVDQELDDWDERVERDADDESQRAGNASSRWSYLMLGLLYVRWRAMGTDPCDYCRALDGQLVGAEESFLKAGAALTGAGGSKFISQSSIGHPPLHTGCKCMITTG